MGPFHAGLLISIKRKSCWRNKIKIKTLPRAAVVVIVLGGVGRQTETFKMVRSSSGNVYASGETISAAGQQWEIVESVEAKDKRKKSSKTKEQETSSPVAV